MVDHYFKFFALTVVSQFSGIYISSLCDGLAVHLVVLLFSKFSLLPVLISLYSGANSHLSTEFTLPRLVARLRGPFSRTRTRTCSVSTSVPTRVSDMRMPVFPSSDSEVPRYYVQLVTAALLSILNAGLSLKNCFSTEDDIWTALARSFLKPTTLWVIFGTLVVQRSLAGLVIHIFSKACACEKCLLTRSKDVRKRTNSESDSPICLNHPESSEITEKCSSNSTLSTKQMNSTGHNFGILPKSVEGTRSAESKFSAVTTPATPSSKRVADLDDAEVLELISTGKLKTRELESALENLARAVCIRRQDLALRLANPHALERIPHCNFDYRPVIGQCCEEVIGFVPIPLGKVGPLLLDGREHYVPLATTEGCLVASTNRGCRALYLAGGVTTAVFR
ncbi:unnamed protein product [Dibothriocephalus latus]|uniref:Hydroxymethylglutaryl-CoA reductase (NADPH) n=1 Tax=Dibothriocephalus latus TaxID=60516 RepID=A0A3P6P2C1_DIBLA|nr:unnamed protein product [Dibothriocephalus latus]